MKKYLKLFRVAQWIKNTFVFVPLLFSLNLFHPGYLLKSFGAFVLFCLLSSIVYIINDIADIEADKLHPIKKNRQIASGKISKVSALNAAAVLTVIVLLLLQIFNVKFMLTAAAYLSINILYSYRLKHIVILDVFLIAAGFMLRVMAGAYAIEVETSSWLILTTMFVSLFLGVMKRRSELKLISNGDDAKFTRKVLAHYSSTFTDQMATVAAAGVIVCYALYTVAQRTVNLFGTENMIYTTPFVVFGIFRYMYLVYLVEKGESTSEIMITDVPMIINLTLYILATTLIIYSKI